MLMIRIDFGDTQFKRRIPTRKRHGVGLTQTDGQFSIPHFLRMRTH
jgi:hypothetical protein